MAYLAVCCLLYFEQWKDPLGLSMQYPYERLSQSKLLTGLHGFGNLE